MNQRTLLPKRRRSKIKKYSKRAMRMNVMLIRIQRIRGQIPSEDRNPCIVIVEQNISSIQQHCYMWCRIYKGSYDRPQRFKNLTEECFLWRCCSGWLSSEEGWEGGQACVHCALIKINPSLKNIQGLSPSWNSIYALCKADPADNHHQSAWDETDCHR